MKVACCVVLLALHALGAAQGAAPPQTDAQKLSAKAMALVKVADATELAAKANALLQRLTKAAPDAEAKVVLVSSGVERSALLPDGTILVNQSWAQGAQSDDEFAARIALELARKKLGQREDFTKRMQALGGAGPSVDDPALLLSGSWLPEYERSAGAFAARLIAKAELEPAALITPDERIRLGGGNPDTALPAWVQGLADSGVALHRCHASPFFTVQSGATPQDSPTFAGKPLFATVRPKLTASDLAGLTQAFDAQASSGELFVVSGRIVYGSVTLVTEPGPDARAVLMELRASLTRYAMALKVADSGSRAG